MIIGISGKMGSGKDTVAKMLIDKLHESPKGYWEIMKFSKKLKQIASILTGLPEIAFEDQDIKASFLGEEWSKYNSEKLDFTPMSVREFLQKLGTEAIRNNIHKDAWVNALFTDYRRGEGEHIQNAYPNWIITDVRFANEAAAILDRDGILLRIQRNIDTGNHPSETDMDTFRRFSYVIENNSDLHHLSEEVHKFASKIGIISK